MNYLKDLQYDRLVPIESYLNINGLPSTIYLIKTYSKGDKKDVFHLKLYCTLPSGETLCLGYLYFFISFQTNQSKFIGISVRSEYRNLGLSSLLASNWIKLCLDNSIEFLETIKTQRKPFLLYLLKKFSFELKNPSFYINDRRVITICKKENSDAKCLLFKDKSFETEFAKSKIMVHDNYEIVPSLSQSVIRLDDVVISRQYILEDKESAYQKALDTKKRHI